MLLALNSLVLAHLVPSVYHSVCLRITLLVEVQMGFVVPVSVGLMEISPCPWFKRSKSIR